MYAADEKEGEGFDLSEDVEHGIGDVTPLDVPVPNANGQHDERHLRTAYYNTAAEKSLSHAEAKLFFHRHQLETAQHDAEAHSPLARARTFSSTVDGDGGLSRTASTASRRSGWGNAQRDRNWRLTEGIASSPILKGIDLDSSTDDVQSNRSHLDPDDAIEKETELEGVMEELDTQGPDISPELSAISTNIKTVLDLRHKYIELSLQGALVTTPRTVWTGEYTPHLQVLLGILTSIALSVSRLLQTV